MAHQGLAYLVALRGAGVDIQDIFDLMDATADSGVVFGEFQVDYHGVLRPGATYDVKPMSSRSNARAASAPACSTSSRFR